ncbi:hypothetical protein I4U23_027539 [Adineta vaga]|nr:hypothetical protein I4U23_027539 [Adineta vaga]
MWMGVDVRSEGTSYRDLKITTKDLRPYRWSLRKKAANETKTFCSTSLDRQVAQPFAELSKSEAINLGKISDKEPCISEYENEAEVLRSIRVGVDVRVSNV